MSGSVGERAEDGEDRQKSEIGVLRYSSKSMTKMISIFTLNKYGSILLMKCTDGYYLIRNILLIIKMKYQQNYTYKN